MHDFTDRLRELSVLKAPPEVMGLPRHLFWGLTVAAAAYGLLLAWWFGVLLWIVVFAPLYRAHQGDSNATAIWIAALRARTDGVDPALSHLYTINLE